MSAPPPDPSDLREWLRRARSNLARARAGRPTPEVLLEDLAFDAQQPAEKAIKAVLIARGISPPRTDSFGAHISRVEEAGVGVIEASVSEGKDGPTPPPGLPDPS